MAGEAMNTEMQDTNAGQETQQEENSVNECTENQQADNSGTENESARGEEGSIVDENNVESGTAGEEAPFLTARYNKQDIPLTREQAAEFAQKGMHYGDKLEYLAHIQGVTVNELLKGYIEDVDNKKRKELEEQYGEDEKTIELYLKEFHEENKLKHEKAIADEKLAAEQVVVNRNKQIAEEFLELQKEYPNLKTIEDIPPSVIKDAQKISLEHAYLKYRFKENEKINEAKAKETENAQNSAGSVSNSAQSSTSATEDAFLEGLKHFM